MNRDDIIRMAREAEAWGLVDHDGIAALERFANLIAAAERERIIAANAPEIEKVNVYIKTLEDAAEALRARLAGWERVNMNDHKEGDLGIGAVKWDASAPLVMHPHPAFQATQPQPDLAKVGEVGVWGERQWQGLTDEEVIKLGGLDKDSDYFGLWYDFARAIEAKLKEKNT